MSLNVISLIISDKMFATLDLIKSIFKCIQAKHLINLDMNHSIIFLANFHTPSGNLAFFLYTFHTSSGNLAKNVSRLIQSNVNIFFDQFLKLV